MLDTVHGYFKIDKKFIEIIDSPLFQRLGYIRQLTSVQYIFSGARHTRKEHSIGAMHITNKYIKAINSHPKNKLQYNEDELEISALLHDVAHGPYSHSFDSTVYSCLYNKHKGHDVHRHILLDYFKYFLPQNINLEKIKDIWNNKLQHLSAIISGPLSVDRMDFTIRDSYYTGVNYGIFDIDRIVNNCWFDFNDKNEIVLVYDSKIVKSAIQGLNSRLYMYEEIYLNRNVVAASLLIECMILKACKVLNLVERVKNIDSFIYLNDESLFNEILFSTSEELKESRKYAKLLYERKLPKMLSEKRFILKNDIKSGIEILENNKIKWTSRVLTKNFISEFEKYNIHIFNEEKLYTFKNYISNENLEISNESYYFERIYELKND
jgi:HD superfamily phosphohydrolase